MDPRSFVDLAADASDNSIRAVYDIEPIFYQTNNIQGPHFFSKGNNTSANHTTFTVNSNDTSVIVATEGAQLNLSHVHVVKHGYSSNLYQASFYGSNAPINVANDSSAYITNSNISVHNGAANVFAFGSNTVVYISDSNLYSSGPVLPGLYAAGNGTIVGKNIRHYSGGNRCSSFSGNNPAGTGSVYDSVAHTPPVLDQHCSTL
ncbi:hypothetical protein MPH_04110 [Macrophomina phaseolina MS6]|uniref:Uncharacterized protein n=1 Tax=Macrophomina phaseolina (strain MS6) TaxID=1126212 RepID=K2S121_MACPH|nr:hypothetical protein MPH_04110 [Macrophomina phaseolina MS6]